MHNAAEAIERDIYMHQRTVQIPHRNTHVQIKRWAQEYIGTLPWGSEEWLNQANFPFFLSGKPAGAFPFTDKMVKNQEQDINREHAARDSQKKKKQGTQLTSRTATSYLSLGIKNARWKSRHMEEWNITTVRLSQYQMICPSAFHGPCTWTHKIPGTSHHWAKTTDAPSEQIPDSAVIVHSSKNRLVYIAPNWRHSYIFNCVGFTPVTIMTSPTESCGCRKEDSTRAYSNAAFLNMPSAWRITLPSWSLMEETGRTSQRKKIETW